MIRTHILLGIEVTLEAGHRAWAAYEPAAPVTGEGLALAGFGFLTGWGALRFLGAVRRRAAPRSRVRA